MTVLIAHLSSGKGTWGQVSSLVSLEKWKKVYLICNDFAYQNFEIDPKIAIKLKIDENKSQEIFEKLTPFFKKELKDEFEVAINLTSGTGNEHMAVLSAILKAGVGIRFVYVDFKELKEFKLLEQEFTPQEDEDLIF